MDYTRIQPLTLRQYIAAHEEYVIENGLMPDVLRLMEEDEKEQANR